MKDPEEMAAWNNGMPTPAAFEKALRAIAIAEAENRIIITFIDTPGADPTEESEAGGIAWKIGQCMQALAEATVPTISVIINRGCSGGAIALSGCDRVLAMQYATYLVISPEACSSILFHTRHKAALAAKISKITAEEALHHGIIDELIIEGEGPAHRFREGAMQSLHTALLNTACQLSATPRHSIFEGRIKRWGAIGRWESISPEALATFEKKSPPGTPLSKKTPSFSVTKVAETAKERDSLILFSFQHSRATTSNVRSANTATRGFQHMTIVSSFSTKAPFVKTQKPVSLLTPIFLDSPDTAKNWLKREKKQARQQPSLPEPERLRG